MSILARRRSPKSSQFERAADGSMTLMEHLRELRSRLFKACLGIVVGLLGGLYFAGGVLDFLTRPYCELPMNRGKVCAFVASGPMDPFLLNLRVALYIGLLVSAPFWLYQLWAFIAPGLHKRERRYTYGFAAAATPLFLSGAVLAHFVAGKSLKFFLSTSDQYNITVGLPGYFDFVTGMMLLFGAGFEFPLIVVMLNFAGVVSARKLLSWWRIAVFMMFLFGAIVTPTPDPFGMSILAGSMALLYFAAVGVAFINDRRRRRKQPDYANLDDDEVSPLGYDREPVAAAAPIDRPAPVNGWSPVGAPEPVSRPLPLDSRYDDTT